MLNLKKIILKHHHLFVIGIKRKKLVELTLLVFFENFFNTIQVARTVISVGKQMCLMVEKANGNHIRPLPVASRRVNEDEINALLAEVCVPSGAVKEDDTDDTDEVEAVTDDQVAAALEFLE